MKIKPTTLTGTVKAPSSKSMTHRVLITSALAEGQSTIESPLESVDTLATVQGLEKLGVEINQGEDSWVINGKVLSAPVDIIDCHESGTTLRLLTGVASILGTPVTLSGAPQLLTRPNKPLLNALEQLGVKVTSNNGYPPITVCGSIKGGSVQIRGDVSSQFISSIILAAPYAESPVDLKVTTALESKPYVEMTIDAMVKSGVNPQYNSDLTEINVPTGEYRVQNTHVEGDWSSAAFLLAAGALSGKVHVDNISLDSRQADREIFSIIDKMGAYIKRKGNRVTTELSILNSIEADLSDCPDLFPIVACLCGVAEGKSKLTGLGRLRHKESDRLAAVADGLTRMGIKITHSDSTATITGGKPRGAIIDSYNDHRIAMSFAVLAQAAEGETTIMNPECVTKSYPGFWGDLKALGADLI